MGVSNLQKLINDLLIDVNIGKTGIIVDGEALYYSLYFNSDPKLDKHCGGDYPGFKDEVCKFFQALKDCEVTPYVILDGDSGSEKQKTRKSRQQDKQEKAKKIAESEPGDPLLEGCDVLPPLVKDVFIEVLKEKGIAFKQCLGEADPEVFSAANEKECPVLSADTDFCIYDLHKGFLHLHNFEWKRKKDGNVPAKLFTRSKFCEHFGLDPALMPVFASIAGNDYSRLDDNGKFAELSKEENPPTDPDIKRLHGILSFLNTVNLENLNDSQKRDRALNAALTHVGIKENKTFKLALQKYVEPGKTSSTLPSWVREKINRGEFTFFITSVVDQPSSGSIRQHFNRLLTGKDSTNNADRVPSGLSSDEWKKLQLQRLNKAPEDLRQKVFEKALQVQISALKNIPSCLKLPVCVTSLWFRELQQDRKAKSSCLHALLLWFVFGLQGSEDEFERRMKALKDEGMKTKLQPPVARAFIRWQCCMRQSLHLNQLLCSPLPEPQCARLYCGPLLHRLADEDTIKELEDTLTVEKKKLYEDLKGICHPPPEEPSSQSSTGEGSSSGEGWQPVTNKRKHKNKEEQRNLKQRRT